jgi:S1-C subfamily serine protease
MKHLGLAPLAAGAVLAAQVASAAPRQAWERGVVGLEITWQAWDESRPWAKKSPAERHATGVVVASDRILTTAQMVADATLVKLETFGRTTDVTLDVVRVDAAIDLALLAPRKPAALSAVAPVRLARRTPREGVLQTVRWSDQQLETATSRVRRFDVEASFFDSTEHAYLLLQTDMSGGGWAEPVFEDARLVGLTANQDSSQRSRAIPVEILSAFLDDTRGAGAGRRFASLGVSWQAKESEAVSAFLGQTGPPRGVIILQVPWGSSGCGVLKPRDVLLALDGKEIDGAGYYAHPRLGRLRFTHIAVDGHWAGDVVPVRVLRDGRTLDTTMTLAAARPELELMPSRRGSEPPPYVVVGGLVFRELDGAYLSAWGPEWMAQAPAFLTTRYLLGHAAQRPDTRREVIISSVLPAAFNVGYQDLRNAVVERINGRAVDSLNDVVESLSRPEGGFHTISLAPGSGTREIVLDAGALETATRDVLETYQVPAAARLPREAPPDPGPDCPGDF